MNTIKSAILPLVFMMFFFVSQSVPLWSCSQKSLWIEMSGGLSLAKPLVVVDRLNGIQSLELQYAGHYNVATNTPGSFNENILQVPLQLSVSMAISPRWLLKGGVEWGFGGSDSDKTYEFLWQGGTEVHRHQIENNLAFAMPFLGVSYRRSFYEIFLHMGFGKIFYSSVSNLAISDPGYGQDNEETLKASGWGLGVELGTRFRFKWGNRRDIHISIGYHYLSSGVLDGNKEMSQSNGLDDAISRTIEGNLYRYDIDPYGLGRITSWDLFSQPPDDLEYSSVEKSGISLSMLRIMVGISFRLK